MKRVDEKQVQQLFELSSKAAKTASEPAKEEKKTEAESEAFVFEPLAPNIAFDDFAKVDLRIGKTARKSKRAANCFSSRLMSVKKNRATSSPALPLTTNRKI